MPTDLLDAVLDAHGGLDRWRRFSMVEATIVSGGLMFELKGQPQDPTPRRMTVALHREWSSVRPFGAEDQKTDFTPDRIAIEKLDGRVVGELRHPRDSFAGHTLTTPWNPLQRAYFNGYALWTYLTSPFLLTLPGFSVHEIASDDDQAGLQWRIPAHLASHCAVQEFYVGPDHLVTRHDYRVDIAGGFSAVHYVSDYRDVDGIQMPTTRRAYRCGEDGSPLLDELMVSIDLTDITLR
ncbi:MAG: hypothetical protein JST91_19895 [Actinobacteria bacterium]|nr:hypothetical protein [Actinomycetota bacterium]